MEIKELCLPPNYKKITYEIGKDVKIKLSSPTKGLSDQIQYKEEKPEPKWIDCRIELGLLNSIHLTKDNKFKNTLRDNPYDHQQEQLQNSRTSENLQEITCNCSKTKCIKLYCMCFANNLYCKPECSCKGCSNHIHNEKKLEQLREYNHSRKIIEKNKGCRCQKSNCTKKYCECFGSGQSCNEMCECTNCHNKVRDSKSLLKIQEKLETPKRKRVG